MSRTKVVKPLVAKPPKPLKPPKQPKDAASAATEPTIEDATPLHSGGAYHRDARETVATLQTPVPPEPVSEGE